MSGKEYADLIASYIYYNYSNRGIEIYREVFIGKSIIGKNRKIDIVLWHRHLQEPLLSNANTKRCRGLSMRKSSMPLRICVH